MALKRLAALLAAAITAAATHAAAQPPARADGYFQETLRVAPRVWLLAQPRFQVQPCGNVTVIEQDAGLVLVDAGGSPGEGRRVVEAVRRLSAKPVTAVILTHWHGDHVQGLAEILKVWPSARTIATTVTKAHLADPKTMNTPARADAASDAAFQKRIQGFLAFVRDGAGKAATPRERQGWAGAERLFTQYSQDMTGASTVAPAEGVEDRLTLPDRTAPVEIRFLGRANTDGDAVVWLPRQKIVVTGDIVVLPFPYGYGSYPEEWIQTLKRLRALPFTVLIPGHGQPQRDRAAIDRLEAAIRDVRRQIGEASKAGGLDAVRKQVDVTAQAHGYVGDDPWMRRWFQEFWVRPIVASAYKEATGQPIIQGLGG